MEKELIIETEKYMLSMEKDYRFYKSDNTFTNDDNNNNFYNDSGKKIYKKINENLQNEDKLFWTLYKIIEGEYAYEIDHSFKKEKEYKIHCIEKLRKIKSELKGMKLKLEVIEDELLNKNKIDIKSLLAISLLNKKNIMYMWDRKFIEVINNCDENFIIIEKYKYEYKIIENDPNMLKYCRENFWEIENIDKPLKSISSYTKLELTTICKKLNINSIETLKNKKNLYEKILENI